MPLQQKRNEIQAILFAAGEPLELSKLAKALGLGEQEAAEEVEAVNAGYAAAGLPFRLLRLGGSVQMCTEPEYAPIIREALSLRRSTPLSQAAFEVLAIIAYNQPVTKAFVEQVRGVDSSGIINSLVEKGLVGEQGRMELPGRPICYGTTEGFLRCFSLSSLEELPQFETGGREVAPTEADGIEEATGETDSKKALFSEEGAGKAGSSKASPFEEAAGEAGPIGEADPSGQPAG